jgi:TolB-like protein/tetratricopeptide (TPR) repeat protein
MIRGGNSLRSRVVDSASTPQRWFAELRRRKVFRVVAVYAVVAWLLVQVAETTFEPMGLPAWTVKLVITLAILGLPLACVLAWAFDVTPKGVERTAAVSQPDPVATSSPASATKEPGAEPPAESVAILPFVDMSPEHDQEYFCDGIAEEIINALCCVRGLRIASRTSSFRFKGRSADVRRIGRQLDVRAVLEGSVRKAGNRVRITAQLINCADGYHLWSQTYDRELEDVFAVQTDIAQRLVDALRITLTPRETKLIERGGTRNAQAYDLFLRGQQVLRGYNVGGNAESWFRQAIKQDPDFAQAHAGLASALALKGFWRVSISSDEIAEAFAASQRALELEPWMPEAFVAKACLASMSGMREEAERSFEEAIRLNPASYYTHYLYGRHFVGTDEPERAVEQFRAAAQLAPDEYTPYGMLSSVLRKLGRHAECLQVTAQALPLVERYLEVNPHDDAALGRAAIFAAWLGKEDLAVRFIERALALRPDGFAGLYNAACAYADLGRHDRALELLDRAVGRGRGNLEWIERDESLAALRDDPRFAAITARLRGR